MICTHNLTDGENYKLKDYSNTVPIHDLYANMQFWFSYPMSETQSYYLLQDCLFSLYFQLYFMECQTHWQYKEGYGWGYCKYGEGVKCEDDGVKGVNGGTGCLSWICPEAVKKGHGKGQCGTSGKQSPLQAFLTDCLKGFTCEKVKVEKLKKLRSNSGSTTNNSIYSKCYPGFLDHRNHLPVGQECAVPMGFSGSFRKGGPASGSTGSAAAGQGMIGLGIHSVIATYASTDMSSASLYQITRCICSLTRRVPRSVGTIYGFFYGLVDVCNSTKGGKDFKPQLEDELRCCPGTRDPQCLMGAVVKWRGTSHATDHVNGSLDSLYNNGDQCDTCGKYLQTLSGSLYKSVAPQFTATYLSWIIHLTWILHKGLESFLEAFRDISCEDCGCSKKDDCKSGECKKGTHGNPECCCDNVVDCVGVHGLFYRFGFSYTNTNSVAGKADSKSKRECSQFYDRLKKVVDGEYYQQLTKEIYRFLYTTRALFGLYIGVYWSAVMGYLLWSITGPLDVLHIQSHWRSPRSYLVPLQRILADGSRKGFCTLGYFQEGTGDSLLSEGISDVYL